MNIYDEAIKKLIVQNDYEIIFKALERAKKVEEFIINVFIECDELGLEPTTLTNENGKDIVTRWRKELEMIKLNQFKID